MVGHLHHLIDGAELPNLVVEIVKLVFDGGSDQCSWKLLACVFIHVPVPEVAFLVGDGHISSAHTRY